MSLQSQHIYIRNKVQQENIFNRLLGKCYTTRVAKFDPKVGSRRTTKIKNLVALIIILVVLILLLIICLWH